MLGNDCESGGISEVVGVIMLIGVFVAVIGVIGIMIFSDIETGVTPAVVLKSEVVYGPDLEDYLVLSVEAGDDLLRPQTEIRINGVDRTSDFTDSSGGEWNYWRNSESLKLKLSDIGLTPETLKSIVILNTQNPENPTVIYLLGDETGTVVFTNPPTPLPTTEPTGTVPPVAEFSGIPLAGGLPLEVVFTDLSTNSPVSWLWDFGDGAASTEQNPVHNYTTFGNFTVTLQATNSAGSDIETKTEYVTVTPSLSCANTGLNGYYFDGTLFSGPSVVRSDQRIVFADDDANTSSPYYQTDILDWPYSIITQRETFSVMYEGYLVIDTEDDYTFYLTSDDGSRLWIDNTDDSDTPVVDNWGLHSAETVSSTIHLEPGFHPVKVKMYENTGDAVFHLEWESGQFSRKFVESFCRSDCCSGPDADFESDIRTGNSPLAVNFTDLSTGAPSSWLWEFGDGTNSTEQNPVHVYQSPGKYTVNLTASNEYGAGIKIRTDYIYVLTDLPCQNTGLIATYYDSYDFTGNSYEYIHTRLRLADDQAVVNYGYESDVSNWAYPITGSTNLFSVICRGYLVIDTEDDYTFYLTSDDGSRLWIDGALVVDNWGDHAPEEESATVTLTEGYHPVEVRMYERYGNGVLQLEWESGQFTREFVEAFIQNDTCGPVPEADFSASPLSGVSPLSVVFTDLSTEDPTSWLWDFGDGNTNTTQNPVHVYASAGVYNVSLKASNSNGYEYENKTGYITVTDFPQPAAWWKFDESSGTTAVDSSGNGNDGTIYGAYSRPAGACNSSLEFDGETTYVSIPDDSTLDTSDKVTVCAWIYPELPVNKSGIWNEYRDTVSVLGKGDNGDGNYEFFMKKTDTESRFTFESDDDRLDHVYGIPYEYNRWQHLACVIDTGSGTGEVYINGNSAGTFGSLPSSLIANDEPVYIGMQKISGGYPDWATFNFNGRMDEVMLYTTALTESQISTIYGKCTPPPVPAADFSADQTTGNAPLTVTFSDLSTGSPFSWSWDFGDGETSSEQNPVHTYASAGTYDVTLSVTGDGGIDSEQKTDYITAGQALPAADFSADPISGEFSVDVQFTDLSTGDPASWQWDFGDGGTSTLQNPTHNYASTGLYTVTLTVTNAAGSDTEQKADYIAVTGFLPETGFKGVPVSGDAPLSVNFTDLSTGSALPFVTYTYLWDFGDGGTSTEQNPVYVYTSPGTYTVSLTVYSWFFGGLLIDSSVEEKTDYITAADSVPLAADFSSSEQGNSGRVTFTDQSTGSPDSWLWDFGDGTTSTEQNPPQHSYTKGATYTVTLTVYRDSLSNSVSRQISV